MKIYLSRFKEDVRTPVQQVYDPKGLELEFVDLKYKSKLVMEGTVEKGMEVLVFEGSLTSDAEHICGRCLESVKEHIQEPFKLFYEVKNRDQIDATDDLREILILKHPLSFLCREDCQLPGSADKEKNRAEGDKDTLTYKAFSSLEALRKKLREDKK